MPLLAGDCCPGISLDHILATNAAPFLSLRLITHFHRTDKVSKRLDFTVVYHKKALLTLSHLET